MKDNTTMINITICRKGSPEESRPAAIENEKSRVIETSGADEN